MKVYLCSNCLSAPTVKQVSRNTKDGDLKDISIAYCCHEKGLRVDDWNKEQIRAMTEMVLEATSSNDVTVNDIYEKKEEIISKMRYIEIV